MRKVEKVVAMTPQDAAKLRADMERVARDMRATFDTGSFMKEMERSRRSYQKAVDEMNQSMDQMRSTINKSMAQYRDAYKRTPEYRRSRDVATNWSYWMTGLIIAVGGSGVAYAISRAVW